MGKNMSKIRKLTFSAMVVGSYVVVIYFTQGFSFGAFQIRIATSLYALAYIYPFLSIPLGIANVIANLLCGGLGVIDIIGGGIVGGLTAWIVGIIGKKQWNVWFSVIPITIVPGCIVSIWLSLILQVPYPILVINLCAGQILPAILGVALVKKIRKLDV